MGWGTTTETSTTYKCWLFKTGDFVLKSPACFAISFGTWYCLAQGFFLFLPEIIICSFNNNEVRNAPMAKLLYHATASAQFFAKIT